MDSVFLITFKTDGTPRMLFKDKKKALDFCKRHDNADWEEWEILTNDR